MISGTIPSWIARGSARDAPLAALRKRAASPRATRASRQASRLNVEISLGRGLEPERARRLRHRYDRDPPIERDFTTHCPCRSAEILTRRIPHSALEALPQHGRDILFLIQDFRPDIAVLLDEARHRRQRVIERYRVR